MGTTKPKILCVDDEPAILRFLEVVLVRNEYDVIQAENGEEAFEKLERENIDLVLTDVNMPKMDGFELCRKIKGDEHYRDIPVVMITGLAEKQDRVKGIEAGAEDFISKPIEPAEVLARVKMLLEAKALHEKRTGQLFVELGFVTPEHLEEALSIARERKIKIGEALYRMGALDRDHIYWVLSNHLNMNYIELSPEMIDKDLIGQFSMETLEELQCLPLYETTAEIHFAIADPTDQQIVKKVKGLRPGKAVQLHLALPEKIMGILALFERKPITPQEEERMAWPVKEEVPPPIIEVNQIWERLAEALLSLSQDEIYWFDWNPAKCRLLLQKGDEFKEVQSFSEGYSSPLRNRLLQNVLPSHFGEGTFFLFEQATNLKAAFKLSVMGCLDRGMIRIERMPEFSEKELVARHPQALGLIVNLVRLLNEHHRLLIGGKDGKLIKQYGYFLLKQTGIPTDFPPAIFIEHEIDIYFPEVVRIPSSQFKPVQFFNIGKGMQIPFLLWEIEFSEMGSFRETFSNLSSEHFKNVVLSVSFATFDAMRQAFSGREDWREGGFRALFVDQDQLRLI